MQTNTYTITRMTRSGLMADLARPIEAATLALARIDERLARCKPMLADGVRARFHLFEAQALAQLAGELASLEDLVLHDAGMDVRAPSTGVVRAQRILDERRSLARRTPEAVMASEALSRLLGVAAESEQFKVKDAETGLAAGAVSAAARPAASGPWDMPKPFADDGLWPGGDESDDGDGLELSGDEDGEALASNSSRAATGDLAAIAALLARPGRLLSAFERPPPETPSLRLRDPDYGASTRLMAWLDALRAAEDAPAVLATAIAIDAWLMLEPAERGGEVGFALAATILRQRDIAAHHLPALGLGYRKGRFRWSPHQGQGVRLAGLIEAMQDSARLADSDLKRLSLAREVMARRCEGRRGNSKLPQLVDLFMASPLVTVQMATEKLKVAQQAVEVMLKELGS
ncbi:MAG: RHE_PE00001 family protein, partial [Hyphomicrobiales bacterium]|nr:RHE_PE00001 family protein [Hyphomicrobiales bacterium]